MNKGHKPPARSRAFLHAIFGLLVLLPWLSPYSLAAGYETALENPNRVKAAFIRNFAHYVRWPAGVFDSAKSPWHIGVLGDAHLAEVLESALQNRNEHGRKFEIHAADSLVKLPSWISSSVARPCASSRTSRC